MFRHERKISILSDYSPAKYYWFLFARIFLSVMTLSKIGLNLLETKWYSRRIVFVMTPIRPSYIFAPYFAWMFYSGLVPHDWDWLGLTRYYDPWHNCRARILFDPFSRFSSNQPTKLNVNVLIHSYSHHFPETFTTYAPVLMGDNTTMQAVTNSTNDD